MSGVGWDSVACLPVVSDEFIKDYCIGTRKKCQKMFIKKLDNFDDIYAGKVICMIFNNVILYTYSICFCFFVKHATGEFARGSIAEKDHASSSSGKRK